MIYTYTYIYLISPSFASLRIIKGIFPCSSIVFLQLCQVLVAGAGCSQGAEYRPEALVRRRRLGSKRQGMIFFSFLCVCVVNPCFQGIYCRGFQEIYKFQIYGRGCKQPFKWKTSKSPWISILNYSSDLNDVGDLPILGNLLIFNG